MSNNHKLHFCISGLIKSRSDRFRDHGIWVYGILGNLGSKRLSGRLMAWFRIMCRTKSIYAFSPIDLIPDPIPILGYLDDLILVPLGIAIALKMIPKEVMDGYREQETAKMIQGKPVNWIAAIVIIGIWVGLGILAVAIVSKRFIA